MQRWPFAPGAKSSHQLASPRSGAEAAEGNSASTCLWVDVSLLLDGYRYTQLNLSWVVSCLLALLSKYICVLWPGVKGGWKQYSHFFMSRSIRSALILLGGWTQQSDSPKYNHNCYLKTWLNIILGIDIDIRGKDVCQRRNSFIACQWKPLISFSWRPWGTRKYWDRHLLTHLAHTAVCLC